MPHGFTRLTTDEAWTAIRAGTCPDNAFFEGRLILVRHDEATEPPRSLGADGKLRIINCRRLRLPPPGLAAHALGVKECPSSALPVARAGGTCVVCCEGRSVM